MFVSMKQALTGAVLPPRNPPDLHIYRTATSTLWQLKTRLQPPAFIALAVSLSLTALANSKCRNATPALNMTLVKVNSIDMCMILHRQTWRVA